jgi:leucyl/phenylalanyl-tRNA--protein transferase
VIYPQAFSPAKSLRKCFRKQNWAVSINRATNEVIELCANTRAEDETWITNEMVLAYQSLAEQGHCHSIEVWLDGQLVGGLYGLLIGKVFCGESMFSLTSNASKIAFWHLTLWLSENQPVLIDCQMMNPHLQSLGAVEIARADFRTKLLNLSKQVINPVQTEPKWMVKR